MYDPTDLPTGDTSLCGAAYAPATPEACTYYDAPLAECEPEGDGADERDRWAAVWALYYAEG